jgi:O-antigen ligase/tetratricopeptide (TPR) repeat protein
MTTPAELADSSSPQPAGSAERALGLAVALLLGACVVARPVANQFSYYSGEAGFANMTALLFAFLLGFQVLLRNPPLRLPDRLMAAGVLWIGVFLWAALRSPNLGSAVPLFCDAAIYLLLLYAGWFMVRRDAGLADVVTRVLLAMIVVEAIAGIWQSRVDLPWLQYEINIGREQVPESLQGAVGLARLYGTDAFGTFGNPNSLAAYLLVGIWLAFGLTWPRLGKGRLKLALPIFVLHMLFFALAATHSKGAYVACAAGGWFFLAQRLALKKPRWKRALWGGTALLFALGLVALALGMAGHFRWPRSLEVRFEYWKAACGMLRDNVLDGVGLGGFAENYSFHKTALGGEVREAHNDFLHLWTELGILGPVIYAALWALILRAGGKPGLAETPSAAVEQAPSVEPPEAARAEKLAILGGVFAFLLLYAAFNVFNSGDAALLLDGVVNRRSVSGLVHSFALPFFFACVVIGMRTPTRGRSPEERTAWVHGLRAAAGAVLVHQLVDFDFKAQAVMGGLFLLGGTLLALSDPAQDARPTLLARASRFVLPLGAVLLIPGAVYVPMASGLPRESADLLEERARKMARGPALPGPGPGPTHQELRLQIMQLRQAAVRAAPFDGSAWLDLAAAYEGYQRPQNSLALHEKILDCLDEGERLRSHSASPKLMRADYWFRVGMRLQRRGMPAGTEFADAAAAYEAAAQRYPLAPPYRVLAGDAQLMQGQVNAAVQQYRDAFALDMRIADHAVRFSAIFTDPRPTAVARHGFDADVLNHLEPVLRLVPTAPPGERPALAQGLLFRRLLALGALLNEDRRTHSFDPKTSARAQLALTQTGADLIAAMDQPAERAHAAFLHAVSFELLGAPDPAAKAAAWEQARRLQAESVQAGAPGTLAEVFDAVDEHCKPKPEGQ